MEPLYAEGDKGELKPFYEGLAKHKSALMNRLGISGKEYDMMSKLLLGISMQESSGGSDVMHNAESSLPFLGSTIGLTQLNWKNIQDDPTLKAVADEFNIKSKNDLADPEKAAIASIIYGYRNLKSGKENYSKGKKTHARTYKPSGDYALESTGKWIFGKDAKYDGYQFETDEGPVVDFFTGWNALGIGADKDLEDIQAQFDEIAPGKYKVYEDEDGNRLVDKKTLGSGHYTEDGKFKEDLTDEEIFIYNWNSPTTLRYGDAQGDSRYLQNINNWLDLMKKQEGGEIAPKYVKQMEETLDDELFKLEGLGLKPAQRLKMENNLITAYNDGVPKKFRRGGVSLSPELSLYKGYILGNDESDKARKNYDKLNRVHYREAKLKNMSAPNFIMTELIA
jgi:hypothetical protein